MKILNVLGFAIIAFLGITGGMIQSVETIPNNAQVDVFPAQKAWLPHHKSVSNYLVPKESGDENMLKNLDMMSNITSATYKDVWDGKYQGFKLPNDFGKDEDYRIGYNQSQLWTWIFGKKNR